jgi:hypothetical protein
VRFQWPTASEHSLEPNLCRVLSRISKLNNGKTGDQSKVTGIERRNRIAEVQGRAANQQVFERDADPMSSLLSLDLSS